MHPSLRLSRRQALVLGGLGGLQALAPNAVRAQAPFPNRLIQFIVAAPAGGPSDNAARMIADEMGKLLGQPMVVVNKPGSAGVIAAEATARAAPDGHTLMLSWIGNATSPGLVAKLPFDINRDFVHITLALAGANALIVHPSTGFKTLADLVKHAKANPGRLSYASSGNGTSGHLAMEMFRQRAGEFGTVMDTLRHLVEGDRFQLWAAGAGVPLMDASSMGSEQLRQVAAENAAAWRGYIPAHPDGDERVVDIDDSGWKRTATVGLRLAQPLQHGIEHRTQVCTAMTLLGLETPDLSGWGYGVQHGVVSEVLPQ